jgi:hypothetical protein
VPPYVVPRHAPFFEPDHPSLQIKSECDQADKATSSRNDGARLSGSRDGIGYRTRAAGQAGQGVKSGCIGRVHCISSTISIWSLTVFEWGKEVQYDTYRGSVSKSRSVWRQ